MGRNECIVFERHRRLRQRFMEYNRRHIEYILRYLDWLTPHGMVCGSSKRKENNRRLFVLKQTLNIYLFHPFLIRKRNKRELDAGKDAYYPREEWDPYDPMLVSEGVFAAGMIFSFLKLVVSASRPQCFANKQ